MLVKLGKIKKKVHVCKCKEPLALIVYENIKEKHVYYVQQSGILVLKA